MFNKGQLLLAAKALEIIDTKWYQFSLRRRLNKEAEAIAKKYNIEY